VRLDSVEAPWAREAFLAGLSVEERVEFEGRPASEQLVQPVQETLVMGDAFAVEQAQIAHCNVLRRGGLLGDDVLVTYRSLPPRGDMWGGLMVDDYIVAQVTRRGRARDGGGRCRDEEAGRAVDPTYAAWGLTAKLKKRRRHCKRATGWGGYVDGVAGWCSASDELTTRTVWATIALLPGGATRELWESILGLWAHLLIFCRPGFCLLHAAYRDCRQMPVRSRELWRLSAEAEDELLMACLCAPLFGSDLRASYPSVLYATDASPWAGAVVEAEVGEEVVRELWRRRERKGGPGGVENEFDALGRVLLSAEDDGLSAWDREVAEEAGLFAGLVDPDHPTGVPWVNELCEGLGWTDVRATGLAPSNPITIKEAQARRLLIRVRASDPGNISSRAMAAQDSKALLGAAAKGRSPSRKLNGVFRSTFGEEVLGGVLVGGVHVGTKFNPSDNRSRGRETRAEAARAPPAWLAEVRDGRFEGIDRIAGTGRESLRASGVLWPWPEGA